MNKPLDLSKVKVYSNTKEDVIKAISLIGQDIYMSDDENFSDCVKGELLAVRYGKDSTIVKFPFLCGIYGIERCAHYKYFILEKDAKFKDETSYRKFNSIDEFEYVTQNNFSMGDSIIIRNKETHNESELVYGGYFVNDQSEVFICLGAFIFTLEELFKGYEFHINDDLEEWCPFGVEE